MSAGGGRSRMVVQPPAIAPVSDGVRERDPRQATRSRPQGTDRSAGGYRARDMQVAAISQPAASSDADTVAIGVFEDEELPAEAPEELGALLASGEARRSFKK